LTATRQLLSYELHCHLLLSNFLDSHPGVSRIHGKWEWEAGTEGNFPDDGYNTIINGL